VRGGCGTFPNFGDYCDVVLKLGLVVIPVPGSHPKKLAEPPMTVEF